MMLASLLALVINGATSQPAAEPPFFVKLFNSMGPILPIGIILLIFMMFMSKSKKKQENERQSLLDNLKKGDQIETIGGLIGTVVSTNDDEKTVTVKVDETANVKMKFNRRAVHRVITDEKAEKK